MSEAHHNAFAYQLLDVEKASKALAKSQHQNYQYKNTRWRNNFQYHQPQQQPQHQPYQQPQQLSQPALHQHLSQPQIHTLSQQHVPQTYYSDSYLTRQRSYQHEQQPDTPKSMASVPDSKINDLKLFDPFENSSIRALTPSSTSGSLLSSLDQTHSPAFTPTVPPQGQPPLQQLAQQQQPQKSQLQPQPQPNLLRSASMNSQYQSGSHSQYLPTPLSSSQFQQLSSVETSKAGPAFQTSADMSSRLWGLNSTGLNSQFSNSTNMISITGSDSGSRDLNFGSSLLSGKSVSNWSNVW